MQRTVFLVHVSKGGMEETHASVSASTSHGITTVGSREEVQQLVNIRPCVGRTVVDGWRSLGWSWESLMARCGSGSVSVLRPAVSSGGRRALHSLSSNLQPLLLHVSEIERGSEKGAEHRVEDGPPQLYEGRLGFLLKYVPELNREVSKRSWTEDKGVLEREELWFETRQGLEQPWTRDTITHSFLFVLKGSRRAFFFPSSPDSPSAMQEDEERLFRDKPATRAEMSSRVVSVVISEGDVLYIPRYWWFKAESLEFTMYLHLLWRNDDDRAFVQIHEHLQRVLARFYEMEREGKAQPWQRTQLELLAKRFMIEKGWLQSPLAEEGDVDASKAKSDEGDDGASS